MQKEGRGYANELRGPETKANHRSSDLKIQWRILKMNPQCKKIILQRDHLPIKPSWTDISSHGWNLGRYVPAAATLEHLCHVFCPASFRGCHSPINLSEKLSKLKVLLPERLGYLKKDLLPFQSRFAGGGEVIKAELSLLRASQRVFSGKCFLKWVWERG